MRGTNENLEIAEIFLMKYDTLDDALRAYFTQPRDEQSAKPIMETVTKPTAATEM